MFTQISLPIRNSVSSIINDFKKNQDIPFPFLIKYHKWYFFVFYFFFSWFPGLLFSFEQNFIIEYISNPITTTSHWIAVFVGFFFVYYINHLTKKNLSIDLSKGEIIEDDGEFLPIFRDKSSFKDFQEEIMKSVLNRKINFFSILLAFTLLNLKGYFDFLFTGQIYYSHLDKNLLVSILGFYYAFIADLFPTLIGASVISGITFLTIISYKLSIIGNQKEKFSLNTNILETNDNHPSKHSLIMFREKISVLPILLLKISLIIIFMLILVNIQAYFTYYYNKDSNDLLYIGLLTLYITLLNILMLILSIGLFIFPQISLRKFIKEIKLKQVNLLTELCEKAKYSIISEQKKSKPNDKKIDNLSKNYKILNELLIDTKKITGWPYNYKQLWTIGLILLSLINSGIVITILRFIFL
jgi:hypothetical protein